VKVWLSDGPGTSIAPDVLGESQRTALVRVQSAGLEVSSVAEIHSDVAPADVVVAQVPEAGARSKRVALLVNRADESRRYVMPDLIGTPGARAAEVLRHLGFRVTVVGEQPYPGVAPGTVLRQQPLSGFQARPGEAISLEVSR
jgi:serine/threonine-protein kinase